MTDFDSGLALLDLPKPEPEADELLVRVEASSINPIDVKAALGRLRGTIEYDFPIVLGRDFAGVVEAVGSDVVGLAAGDAVFGIPISCRRSARAGPDEPRGRAEYKNDEQIDNSLRSVLVRCRSPASRIRTCAASRS